MNLKFSPATTIFEKYLAENNSIIRKKNDSIREDLVNSTYMTFQLWGPLEVIPTKPDWI
jgi:hypothetical protein